MRELLKHFRALFCGRRLDVQASYHDEVLGTMIWSNDWEGWVGRYGGVEYVIGYEGDAIPNGRLLEYARAMLRNRELLDAGLEDAKRRAKSEVPVFAEEIDGLQFESLSFFFRNGERCIFASLSGGERGRSWRAEFTESECEGIGCDT